MANGVPDHIAMGWEGYHLHRWYPALQLEEEPLTA